MKLTVLVMVFLSYFPGFAQAAPEVKKADTTKTTVKPAIAGSKPLYGIASFYADKFEGRQAADGSIYDHDKPTAACNVLPLGTWIRVTNLRNKKSVIVKVTDRLHPKNTRIVDMSRSSAAKLGYISRGITQVKVEVLGKKKPASGVE
jgi:rare lipoprotein A